MKVSVTAKSKVLDFPWNNGVNCYLQGDCTNINNLISELNAVKNMINRDANCFKVPFKELDISFKFI